MSTAIATAPDRNLDAAKDKAILKDETKRLLSATCETSGGSATRPRP